MGQALADPLSSGLGQIIPRYSKRKDNEKVYSEALEDYEARCQRVLPEMILAWVNGKPLNQVGGANPSLIQPKDAIKSGRRFSIQTAPSLGFAIRLICKVIGTAHKDQIAEVVQAWLNLTGACIREGFDDPDKLLAYWHMRRKVGPGFYPRVKMHLLFQQKLGGRLPSWSEVADERERRRQIAGLLSS